MSRKKTDSVMDDPSAFRQQVRIAAVQVTGLRPDELAAALAYEVEPLSGIPAAEAELAYSPVVDPDPTVRVYDVAVRRRKNRAAKVSRRIDSVRRFRGSVPMTERRLSKRRGEEECKRAKGEGRRTGCRLKRRNHANAGRQARMSDRDKRESKLALRTERRVQRQRVRTLPAYDEA